MAYLLANAHANKKMAQGLTPMATAVPVIDKGGGVRRRRRTTSVMAKQRVPVTSAVNNSTPGSALRAVGI